MRKSTGEYAIESSFSGQWDAKYAPSGRWNDRNMLELDSPVRGRARVVTLPNGVTVRVSDRYMVRTPGGLVIPYVTDVSGENQYPLIGAWDKQTLVDEMRGESVSASTRMSRQRLEDIFNHLV